jgi:hypothetical protein
MDILNSAWLLSMLKKSGETPQQRLLSLFDILGGWLNAPHIRDALSLDTPPGETPESLLDYLTQEAKAAGALAPEVLAQQLYFMALGMVQTQLQTHDPSTISHARQAAKALITAQTEKSPLVSKGMMYGLAASLFAAVGIGSLMLPHMLHQQNPASVLSVAAHPQPADSADEVASPAQTADMYSSIEQMRKGVCQFPEALALPEAHQAVYLQNVIGGEVSPNIKDQELARNLMQKVRCDYVPMLMANSTS